MFRGRTDELLETFAHLCPVLDGKGLTSDSGMQGRRGYMKPIIFHWIGASTPVPVETHRLMYQLGTRLLFFEIASTELTEDQLIDYLREDKSSEAEFECRKVVKLLVTEFFRQHPVDSIEPSSVSIGADLLREIARWSQLLAAGRADLKRETENSMSGGSSKAVAAHPPEAAYKIGNYLALLARGSALIAGRTEVDSTDLDLVAHVAISSIPSFYRPLVRAFRSQTSITSTQAISLCNVSPPTARKYLYELSLLGFGELKKGHTATEHRDEEPDVLTRTEKYDWLQPKAEPTKPRVLVMRTKNA